MPLNSPKSSQFDKLTKEISRILENPQFENQSILKNPYIDKLNTLTSKLQVIITQFINIRSQFHSILPNFTKTPKFSRT